LLAAAVLLVLSGFLTHRPATARLAAVVCLLVCLVLGVLTVGEVAFRLAGYDFHRTEAKLRRLPPFFRKPMTPCGTGFFRRTGPEVWRGAAIRTLLRENRRGVSPECYLDELDITVRYDTLGFRDEAGLTNWDVAVAGDSFTELGHLPFDQLFTTRLAQRLGIHVRNLGVSFTGPLTQLGYLELFGLAPDTRDVAIVFFEGNDFEDLIREVGTRRRFLESGRWEPRERRRQTSLLRALCEAGRGHREPEPPPREPDAFFPARTGEQPVTVSANPPAARSSTSETRAALDAFFAEYGALARTRHVRAWFVLMPCKERVWWGLLRFTNTAPEWCADWTPPNVVGELAARCAGEGIAFVDLTPALAAVTRQNREMLFNGMHDTHLNARGAEIVAQALAQAAAERQR
jgi:lysophospholipase L1-like esterase